jgi:hypothetical protein
VNLLRGSNTFGRKNVQKPLVATQARTREEAVDRSRPSIQTPVDPGPFYLNFTEETHVEVNKTEMAVVTQALASADQSTVIELSDLQLALVGGGIADVVFG